MSSIEEANAKPQSVSGTAVRRTRDVKLDLGAPLTRVADEAASCILKPSLPSTNSKVPRPNVRPGLETYFSRILFATSNLSLFNYSKRMLGGPKRQKTSPSK